MNLYDYQFQFEIRDITNLAIHIFATKFLKNDDAWSEKLLNQILYLIVAQEYIQHT